MAVWIISQLLYLRNSQFTQKAENFTIKTFSFFKSLLNYQVAALLIIPLIIYALETMDSETEQLALSVLLFYLFLMVMKMILNLMYSKSTKGG